MNSNPEKSVAEFVRLTQPYHKHLYGIALSLCKDADQAQDLTQEALIRAFEAFDRYRQGESILPWLRQILRNLFWDTFKTGRARHEIAEREFNPDKLSPIVDRIDHNTDDPLAKLERHQISSWLQEEIAALDPSHQQVLELCVMQELSFEEAAEMASIPVGTVASRLARARAQLRERMLRRAAIVQRKEGSCEESIFLDEKGTPARISSTKNASRFSRGESELKKQVSKGAKTPL